jgi:hypothetical protein
METRCRVIRSVRRALDWTVVLQVMTRLFDSTLTGGTFSSWLPRSRPGTAYGHPGCFLTPAKSNIADLMYTVKDFFRDFQIFSRVVVKAHYRRCDIIACRR